MSAPYVFELKDLTKEYPDVIALDHVSFGVPAGEIRAVLGEDGAGKTTLMKILAGLHPSGTFTGQILVDGRLVVLKGPHDAIRHGIGIVPRRLSIFDRLSVAENVTIGTWRSQGGFLINVGETERQARAALSTVSMDIDLDVRAGSLNTGQKRILMIARAAAGNPRLVVLDEPATGLTRPEALSHLMLAVRALAGRGIACLYLTPHVPEAMQIADRITVLRDGAVAGHFDRADFDDVALTRAMLSRQPGRTPGMEDDEGQEGGLMGSLRSLFSPRR